MKSQLLMLSMAGLWLAVSTAHAAPVDVQTFSRPARIQADQLLTAAGVDPKAQRVSVRAAIDPDGRVTGVRVLRSSGSHVTDRTVEAVLKTVIRANPPLGLTDGAVTLNLGDAGLIQANAR